MVKIFQKKISLMLALFLIILIGVLACVLTYFVMQRYLSVSGDSDRQLSIQQLYDAAVKDSITIEQDEILPVISLEQGSPFATYDDKGRILLCTFHKYPDSYPDGADVTITWSDVWTFSGAEMLDWYNQESDDVSDWPLRLKQLIGLPPDSEYSHVTAMWVNPDDIVRPANVQDIGDIQMKDSLADNTDDDFKEWFDDNIVWSYFESDYPWTRLGYTYDWAQDSDEYGLSEFLVMDNSNVTVQYTVTIDEFISMLENGRYLENEAA